LATLPSPAGTFRSSVLPLPTLPSRTIQPLQALSLVPNPLQSKLAAVLVSCSCLTFVVLCCIAEATLLQHSGRESCRNVCISLHIRPRWRQLETDFLPGRTNFSSQLKNRKSSLSGGESTSIQTEFINPFKLLEAIFLILPLLPDHQRIEYQLTKVFTTSTDSPTFQRISS
jgi:hypothetical protein